MKNAKGKSPAFQFYVKDWLSDPELQKAHPTTRGVWINLLCYMWDAPERGKLETNERDLCQLGSCLPEDVKLFLSDVKRLNFCDFSVTCHKNVTSGHGDVTLKNRRMRRDDKYRIKARKRKEKQREKERDVEEINKLSRTGHEPVTQNGNHTPTPTPTPIPTPIPTAKLKEKEYKEKEIYDFYKTEINPSRKSSTRAKENIRYYLKKYSKEQLLETIKNYKLICGDDPEFKKDPANFFGKKDKYFIDCLSENFELPKKEDDDPWEGRL